MERVTYECVEELHRQNVLYAEVRYCPIREVEGGLTGEEYCEGVIAGLERGERDFGVKVRSILCFLRENPGEPVSLTIRAALSSLWGGSVEFVWGAVFSELCMRGSVEWCMRSAPHVYRIGFSIYQIVIRRVGSACIVGCDFHCLYPHRAVCSNSRPGQTLHESRGGGFGHCWG